MIDWTAIQVASLTDVGVRRSHNQDDFAVVVAEEAGGWETRGHFFMVADGMGAHAVGELASKLATDLIPHNYQKHLKDGPAKALRRAFSEANAAIHDRGQKNPDFEGMGTTGTALVLRPEGAWVAHVGDSRLYRIRGGRIEQISRDHSLQWELARRRKVEPEQLTGVPSNVILRSLGPDAAVDADVEGPHPVYPGDTFLLCSDGMSGQVEDTEIGAIVNALPPDQACRLLVGLANLRGGPDNSTVIIARLPAADDGEAAPIEPHLLPWPDIALAAGVVLAAVALVLVFFKQSRVLASVSFVTAILSLGGGIGGIFLRNRREMKTLELQAHRPPRVYRQANCEVKPELLDPLQEETTELEKQALANGWEVNWSLHEGHVEAARRHREAGDPAAAFRELCQTLALLTDAQRRQRNKAEVFNPVWEKRK